MFNLLWEEERNIMNSEFVSTGSGNVFECFPGNIEESEKR
jgi:hypothetical protein